MVTGVSVHVRVLGSIEVTRDGQAIRLAGQGQRAVLGALALEPGRPVSVEPMGARAQGLVLRASGPPAGDARRLQRAPAGTRG
jgi:hypothetical protein